MPPYEEWIGDPGSFGGHSKRERRNLPGDVSSHHIPPARLPDANSVGGKWIMPKEWINLLTDTQTWMLFLWFFFPKQMIGFKEGKWRAGTSVSCHGDLSTLIS